MSRLKTPRRRRFHAAATVAVLGFFAAACGGGSDTESAAAGPGFVLQGEQTIDIETPTTTTAAVFEATAPGAAESAGAPTFDETESTLPTNEEDDPDGEFFDSVGDFMSCLTTEGYSFLGIPSQDLEPTAPVNDPGYIDALTGCAASSQIVTKMRAAEDTSDMTAEEIETSNREFTIFVDCLKGRGWTIPDPTPDENGVLQPPYVEIAQTWTPPDGASILADGSVNTDDFTECGFTRDALN
jgi:hypothetical protein